MKPLRFIVIGGFLGAGKTNTIRRLARAYQAREVRVGIVTNEQATDSPTCTRLLADADMQNDSHNFSVLPPDN